MRKNSFFVLSVIALATFNSYAATPVSFQFQPAPVSTFTAFQLKEKNITTDFNQNQHIHYQQMYENVPVIGGAINMHAPAKNTKTMDKALIANGVLYQDLKRDLGPMPKREADKSIQVAITKYQEQHKAEAISGQKSELVVYVDSKNKAHWAYHVSFAVTPAKGLPAKPNYLLDVKTFETFQMWDNIKTHEASEGGGFGGNLKTGQFTYDGLDSDLPKLRIDRDAESGTCFLKNDVVTVQDRRNFDNVSSFTCSEVNADHNNVWWSGDFDAVNGGYSPANDALYAGMVIQDMYMNWYKVPALVDEEGKQKMLYMRVHEYMDNAYWDGERMTFGDGISMFYPLVSLGVGAHEISHGFTEQHSDLMYWSQSGGLNEAFSDMAAQAAEFYSIGKNSWQIGPEIFKWDGALRYMDQPSKDCEGRAPGDWCSIDEVVQYYPGLDVHYSSGIFNRVFYLIGTADGWDTRKAFDIMVQANEHYWTSYTTWVEAACGVLKATDDYAYDKTAVLAAFNTVGVDVTNCQA